MTIKIFPPRQAADGCLRVSCHAVCLAWAISTLPLAASAEQQPNILWITAEDMSPTLGCYGDDYATTPNIDDLAKHSTRYTHAFATAPVCSPSRACLINGCIATTQGTHPMRSLFPIPEEMLGFSHWLRQAGYYTTNNVKTDYNSAAEDRIIAASWDDCSATAHWRNRESSEQPFFAVFNLMTSHQSRSMVWPYEQFRAEVQTHLKPEEIHHPADAPIPPYYPDTPQVRQTVARYYDCVTAMDKQVGEILAQLDADGLSDQTIVFFYSDHGSGMPRHKRALFDSGMHVPLLIRFPAKYESLAPTPEGESIDRLVCFEDFGPTALSLAGIETLPDFMRGKPFLGVSKAAERDCVFGHRDRVDEIIDLARSVRSKRYLLIRNFMPHLGWNQQNAWCDQAAVRQDFYALARSGEANAAQAQYLAPTRPREALYDCETDPLNLTNLIDSPEHAEIAERLGAALDRHLQESRDLGFVHEIELWKHTKDQTPMEWSSQRSEQDVADLIQAASTVGTKHTPSIERLLDKETASERYWGTVCCAALSKLPRTLVERLKDALKDPSAAVKIQAAGALISHNEHVDAASETLVDLLDSENETIVLHAARTVELLADPRHQPAMEAVAHTFSEAPGDIAWFIRFSTTGYLSRLNQ